LTRRVSERLGGVRPDLESPGPDGQDMARQARRGWKRLGVEGLDEDRCGLDRRGKTWQGRRETARFDRTRSGSSGQRLVRQGRHDMIWIVEAWIDKKLKAGGAWTVVERPGPAQVWGGKTWQRRRGADG
jgi:hypothetical protein